MATTKSLLLPRLPGMDQPEWAVLFEVGEGGRVRVAGTRIPIERIVHFLSSGMKAAEIAREFPVIDASLVTRVGNYYKAHRASLDDYVAELERQSFTLRKRAETAAPASIRVRFAEIQGALRSAAD